MKSLPFWISTVAIGLAAIAGGGLGVVTLPESRVSPEQHTACYGVVRGLSDLSERRAEDGRAITFNARPDMVERSARLHQLLAADQQRASLAWRERRELLLQTDVLDKLWLENASLAEPEPLSRAAACEQRLISD